MKFFQNDMVRKAIKILLLMVESLLEVAVITFLVWFFGYSIIIVFQLSWGYTIHPEGLIKPLIGSMASIAAFFFFKMGEDVIEERLLK